MNPEDLAKHGLGRSFWKAGGTNDCHEKVGALFPQRDGRWVKPDWPHDRRRVILYCHGGGYTSGNLGYSRPLASKLTNATGWETLWL